jgi:hypothetical protein
MISVHEDVRLQNAEIFLLPFHLANNSIKFDHLNLDVNIFLGTQTGSSSYLVFIYLS